MGDKERILVVEDEETLVNKLAENLRSEGYAVSTAMDGDTAWEKVRGEKPNLIILDIMLPGIDGLSLCRMISKDEATKHIPIIILTARKAEMDKIVTLEAGADDYIVKPFSLGELLARVRAILRRIEQVATTPQHDVLEAGNLRLDLTGRRFFKEGEEVKLSNKEFDLLTELMRNQNVALSRDLILTKVWGYDAFVDKRTVDVHIRWLREKIEDDPSNPRRIHTVRSVGYRFEG